MTHGQLGRQPTKHDLRTVRAAPPPGNAAPPAEAGQAAKAAMDRVRANFKGATFKTSQGEL